MPIYLSIVFLLFIHRIFYVFIKYFISCFFLFGLILHITPIQAQTYLICGPDEDGCEGETAEYCSCIPFNEWFGEQPYCLEMENLRCLPISTLETCESNLVYPNQATCLAVIFHSTDLPPCKITTEEYCTANHTYFCNQSGQPDTCKKH